MRKFTALLLCLFFLCPPAAAGAESPKYVALTFEDVPQDIQTRSLLAGLSLRDVRATFFLTGSAIRRSPELPEQLRKAGHEIGIRFCPEEAPETMSRREIAAEINSAAAQLPKNYRVRFLRFPPGICSDGMEQVAGAMGLAVADWGLAPAETARRDASALESTLLSQIRDGDILRLDHSSPAALHTALNLVDLLKARNFHFVTVSELARLRGSPLHPGTHYRSFPPED